VQIAAAGALPPVDLPVREDLRTRLGWGHVFALLPLPDADARAALRREADRRGIFLSDDVMDYLLTRFARDLKHLMALLDQLDGYALAQQRAVTIPLLKKMLSEADA
jgi:DnaA family protein